MYQKFYNDEVVYNIYEIIIWSELFIIIIITKVGQVLIPWPKWNFKELTLLMATQLYSLILAWLGA